MNQEELKYLTMPANYAPYPDDDYAYEAINQLSRALATFRKKYENKIYTLVLSNGETINFEIKGWNLAHLLGIDYKMLTQENMKKVLHNVLELSDGYKINSLVVLNRIIENADKVIDHDEVNSIKILNYYKVMLKSSKFLNLPNFNKFDFGVLNFNKRVYNNITSSYFLPMSTKYIFSQDENELNPNYMLGLKYDENVGAMVPETLMVPNNFSDFIYQQQLVLPLELIINDGVYPNRIKATYEDKVRILNFYKLIVGKYNEDVYISGFKEILPKVKTK